MDDGSGPEQEAVLADSVGPVMALRGRLVLVLAFTFADGAITRLDVIGERDHLERLDIAMLDRAIRRP